MENNRLEMEISNELYKTVYGKLSNAVSDMGLFELTNKIISIIRKHDLSELEKMKQDYLIMLNEFDEQPEDGVSIKDIRSYYKK